MGPKSCRLRNTYRKFPSAYRSVTTAVSGEASYSFWRWVFRALIGMQALAAAVRDLDMHHQGQSAEALGAA